MRMLVALIASDASLVSFFGEQKERIVPRDSLKRSIFEEVTPCVVTAGLCYKSEQGEAAISALLKILESRKIDACIVLAEARMQSNLAIANGSIFPIFFDSELIGASRLNFFHKLISKILRSFSYLLARKEHHLIRLPFRNFNGAELVELRALCWSETEEPTFSDLLDAKIATLGARVRPRRKSKFNRKYVVDDNNRFFDYGHENHARFDTASPHVDTCVLAGKFRFGIRVEELRHYNVSEGEGDHTSVDGIFTNCHGEPTKALSTTHLNMFCNDFF